MRSTSRICLCSAVVLICAVFPACVKPFQDQGTTGTDSDTTGVDTSSSSSTGPLGTASTVSASSSNATTSAGTETDPSATGETATTGVIDPACGNGEIDGDEECDDGVANADDAACTLECKNAICGDGLVYDQIEGCDDGINNGKYGFCDAQCAELGPHCGDGQVQSGHGEQCDNPDIHSGCLDNCTQAWSCQDIRDAGPHPNGVYTIVPDGGDEVKVYCDLETVPMRGYTFLKFHADPGGDNPDEHSADEADLDCNDHGMQLFVPRDPNHLSIAWRVATEESMPSPLGGGDDATDPRYLTILGVEPVLVGESCASKPFNSNACPEWRARDNGTYHVSAVGLPGQPGTNNCPGCSPYFTWNNDGTIAGIEVFSQGGSGARSEYFMCDLPEQ